MFQCRVEQPALTTLSKTTRAPASRCTGRPRRRKRRLWADAEQPDGLECEEKRIVDRPKGNNPREWSKKGTAEAARLMTGVE